MGLGVEAALAAAAVAATVAAAVAAASPTPATPTAAAAAAALASAAAEGFLDPLVLVPDRDLPLRLTALRGLAARGAAAEGGVGARRAAVAGAAAPTGADSTLKASTAAWFPFPFPPLPPKICIAAAEKGDEQSSATCRWGCFWFFEERQRGKRDKRKGKREGGQLEGGFRRRTLLRPAQLSFFFCTPRRFASRHLALGAFDPLPTMYRIKEYDLLTPFTGSDGCIVQRKTRERRERGGRMRPFARRRRRRGL